ncbi:MAG: hypothetical protein C0497_13025 [Gemmatimonas sp.]|nr:hypothetical protein [Gemmatimonas sp.]
MKRTTKYVALDVHQATSVASVREESGRVIARTILPTEQTALREFFAGRRGAIHVAFNALALGLNRAERGGGRGEGTREEMRNEDGDRWRVRELPPRSDARPPRYAATSSSFHQ